MARRNTVEFRLAVVCFIFFCTVLIYTCAGGGMNHHLHASN